MEQTQDSWIDVEGTLKNLNNYGFSTLDCIGEELDNSITAKATVIEFTVNTVTNEVIIGENGVGMTEEGLYKANVFNKRSVSTNDKHGRFGAGSKFYNSKISEGTGVVLQVSKTIDNSKIHQITFDYDKFIQKNSIILFAHQATSDTEKLWSKFAIEPEKSGTLKYIVGSPTIVKELRELIETSDIANSLVYRIGCNYCKEILEKKITIIVKLITEEGEYIRHVIPIDPLCWDRIEPKHKLETQIQIYQNTKFKTNIGVIKDGVKNIYRAKNLKTGRYNTVVFEKDLDLKCVGDITVQSGYVENWENIQRAEIEKLGCVANKGTGIQDFRKNAGGKYIERNNKKIARFDVLKPTSGDTWRYKYTENVRHNIIFSASAEMDEIFGVGVNKNDIREETINKQIWEDAIGFVCDMLTKKLCKMYDPKLEPPKAEPPKAEPPKAEPPKIEPPKIESPKAEPPKTESPKAEPPKAEPPKTEPPKAEPPKTEPPKAEPPKAEPPKAEPPKTEPPKTEPPKTEPPKAEPPSEKQIKIKIWSDACKIIMDKIASGNFEKSMEESEFFMKFAKEL